MYSANDGAASVWHLQHLMQFAISRAGLVVMEATAVERRGRITHGCLGLYSDANEAALKPVLAAARAVAAPGTRFGIQIAHAGRKAGLRRPWEDGKPLGPDDDAWTPCAPSAIPFGPGYRTPEALDDLGLARVKASFVDAARRAVRLGFDVIELHSAHGYLLHTFLSPLSNQRSDKYGGDRVSRMRFPLEVAAAVREAVPASIVLGARLTATDWTENGWQPDAAAAYAKALGEAGVQYVCVSTGITVSGVSLPQSPGYQVGFASLVKQVSGLPTRAVGHIVTPKQANSILELGQADMIALARPILDNPRWVWHAAQLFGERIPYPVQYAPAEPGAWKGAAWARTGVVPE
jgi:2,4-dienoyl-CoA reductase-like NADH-dependent reductase (Old Yellow Enzyme family)